MKYTVASRRIVSKMFGMPGYPFVADLLALSKMIKKERKSTMPRHQNSRYELMLGVGGRGRTEGDQQIDVENLPKSPSFVNANFEHV